MMGAEYVVLSQISCHMTDSTENHYQVPTWWNPLVKLALFTAVGAEYVLSQISCHITENQVALMKTNDTFSPGKN